MQNPGYDAFGVFGLIIMVICLVMIPVEILWWQWRWSQKSVEPIEIPSTPHPWDGSEPFVVERLRSEIDEIAQILSAEQGCNRVYSRFNSQKRCAELYTREQGVVAEISVYGWYGVPTGIVVVSNDPTSTRMALFDKIIPGRVEHQIFPTKR